MQEYMHFILAEDEPRSLLLEEAILKAWIFVLPQHSFWELNDPPAPIWWRNQLEGKIV